MVEKDPVLSAAFNEAVRDEIDRGIADNKNKVDH